MNDIAVKAGWALLTVFIMLNYGLILRALIFKINARVGRRRGIPIYQFYIDLLKSYSLRKHVSHGVMYYLGPVFRLTGGVGMLLFVPVIYGDPRFNNFSFEGDLVLILYFLFFGTLGMALGAGEGGNPNAAIGVSRGLAQMSISELPLLLSIISIVAQYQTLNISDIVAAQQGSVYNWTVFTNPLAVATGMLALLGSFMSPPFNLVIAPNEIPLGPPTEYEGTYLGLLQSNRAIFPVAKLILFTNLFFGGAAGFAVLFLKTFIFFLWPAFVGTVFPRFRTEQSIQWFLGYPTALGVLSIIVMSW